MSEDIEETSVPGSAPTDPKPVAQVTEAPAKRVLTPQSQMGHAPADMEFQPPEAGYSREDEDEEEEDEDEDGLVVFDPETVPLLFDENKFRRQTNVSMDLLDLAQKNLKSLLASGVASDPEIALGLYKETVNGAAKLLDTARKLQDLRVKKAANSRAAGAPRKVTPEPEQLKEPVVEEEDIHVPGDAVGSLSHSRFNIH